MTQIDKNYLLDLLEKSHSDVQNSVKSIDPDLLVYADPDAGTEWRVRDIVGHMATWDFIVAKSLGAYRNGEEYIIPDWEDNEDEFNQQAVLEQRKLTAQQLFAEWKSSHEEFKAAVRDIPDKYFPGDLRYPWGDERGTIATLVEYMTDHAIEHRDEIVKAAQ